MFSKKINLILFFIILIAAVVYFSLNSQKHEKLDKKITEFIDPTKVSKILITHQNDCLILTNKHNKWFVEDEDRNLKADAIKIAQLFDFINNSKIILKVTKDKDAYSEFEVSYSQATKIQLQGEKIGKKIIYLGKNDDKSFHPYVRIDDDPFVYLISKFIMLGTNYDYWTYKVIDLPKDLLSKIHYMKENGKVISIDYNDKDKIDPSKLMQFYETIDNFLRIPVSSYVKKPLNFPKEGKHENIISHILEYKTLGGDKIYINLDIFKYTYPTSNDKDKVDQASEEHYLLISFKDDKNINDFKYLKEISKKYFFKLGGYLDPKLYNLSFEDFFKKEKDSKKAENKQSVFGTVKK